MRHVIHRAVVIAPGMLVVLSAQARGAGSSRQTIIQGVRDDIRRKIQENERAADRRRPGDMGDNGTMPSRRIGADRPSLIRIPDSPM
jgi:hypothetical protein